MGARSRQLFTPIKVGPRPVWSEAREDWKCGTSRQSPIEGRGSSDASGGVTEAVTLRLRTRSNVFRREPGLSSCPLRGVSPAEAEPLPCPSSRSRARLEPGLPWFPPVPSLWTSHDHGPFEPEPHARWHRPVLGFSLALGIACAIFPVRGVLASHFPGQGRGNTPPGRRPGYFGITAIKG